ncbi:hypothetical protein [Aquabacterium sp.]|uniref:hypothetical protein n=1 Tax=Aquabacterium sp. TaxID=1872578 RepID=UPI0027B8ECAF|nr:hypothetical protein [Aquabacterium sp.]
MLSQEDAQLAQVIFRLLKQATSQQVVRNFLKAHGLRTSAANWDDLFTRRIQPALEDETLTMQQLRTLLQEVEECGRQHTFLFQCPPTMAQTILSRRRVKVLSEENGLSALLDTPLDLELPEAPTLVDIRPIGIDGADELDGLLIKQVETRETRVFVGEQYDVASGMMTRTYSMSKKRAVNVAHLSANGLLELRVASQDNKTHYHDNVTSFRRAIAPFIPQDGFSTVSLSKAKNRLWDDREILAEEVRYSNSSARNDFGYTMSVSSSAQEDNLSTDDGSTAAMHSFLQGDGHITGANIYVKIPETEPAREVHILVSGEVNEFAVPVTCSAEDYEYVRRKILTLNR